MNKMHSSRFLALVILLALAPAFGLVPAFGLAPAFGQEVKPSDQPAKPTAERVALPPAAREGRMPLEETLARRQSVREYTDKALTERELGQLVWAAQGINRPNGHRTAPSANARYPLELYVATPSGFFHYDPKEHQLERRSGSDLRPVISKAARGQKQILQSPAVFIFTAVIERMTKKPDDPGALRSIHLEAGHAAQNLLLQAVALDLGGVPMSGFDGAQLQEAVSLPADHRPVYMVAVGHPKQ